LDKCDGGDGYAEVTDYDPVSVMHYSCGNNGGHAGRWISDKDAEGARNVYGSCHPPKEQTPPKVGGDSYGRGAGYVPPCKAGDEEQNSLCYTPCVQGFRGDGPVCWRK
jgi:hypothetical protein